MSAYLTIAAPAEGLYKEKGSKFMGYAYPVKTEDEVKALLDGLRKAHYKASHVCYAYRLGPEKDIFKMSDAGEPHNSAGLPILGQIRSFDLTDVLVAVVRYFGGTKLGVSGLTNAYKEAAKEVLALAQTVEKIHEIHFRAETTYPHLNELLNFVKQNNVRILEQDLAERCIITLSVPKDRAAGIKAKLLKLQNTALL